MCELREFSTLQRGLAPMFRRVFGDPSAPRTIVVVPSLTLDREELAKLPGAIHYEERLLCMLFLLRYPAAHVVYASSEAIEPATLDYYLTLAGVSPADARRRLTMIDCGDASSAPLTEKLLERPDLLARIRAAIVDPSTAHLTCFNATPLECRLAVRLGIPLYGCDPALAHLGTKSGSRDVFRRAGVRLPPGYEHLRGVDEVAEALVALRREHPALRRAVVKLEEGFSGDGNAIFPYDGAPDGPSLARWVRSTLPQRIRCVAADATWDRFADELARMGGIVEAFVDGCDPRSPSVQCRIDPLGGRQIISTHDQVLGGATGQIYLGCTFPAERPCCPGLHDAARRVSGVLADEGVIGRYGIDFISTRVADGWAHHAIEINLRKGGTTHPYLTLQHLTDGAYDADSASFRTSSGLPCHYVASDNLAHAGYVGIEPARLIDAAERQALRFDRDRASGVVFHMLGALRDHGKVGAVAIAATPQAASRLFHDAMALLARLTPGTRGLARAGASTHTEA
jgi:hypothetical protein